MKEERPRLPLSVPAAELLGTAVLISVGVSIVIVMFGSGSPMLRLVPGIAARRAITGFLFGSVGALITVSRVGEVSGAHLNPAVTLGFFLMGKLTPAAALEYVTAQMLGAVAGGIPLLGWGAMGHSVAYGATLPGAGYTTWVVLLGEVLTTFALAAGLWVFLSIRGLRRFTPAMIPFLYAIMVPLEAAISGTSTNPARTFGPAIASGAWDGWWIYWVGPCAGAIFAVLACSFLATRIEVAKLYYFDSDRGGVFHMMSQRRLAGHGADA